MGSARLAATRSQPRVPEPERMKGWEVGEVVWRRRRRSLRVSLKVAMKGGPTWDWLGEECLVSH